MRLPTGLVCLALIVATPLPTRGAVREDRPAVRYEPATEVVLYGTVKEVREKDAPAELKGVHVSLDVDDKVYQIFIAPAAFLKIFDLMLQKGDSLQIRGSKIKFEGSDLVLARQLRRRSDILELRDAKGNPFWEDERLRRTLTALPSARGALGD